MASADLFGTLNRVLEQWAYLSPSLSQPGPLPPGALLETMVELKGDRPAVLALRADEGFGQLLADCARGEQSEPEAIRDAFGELTNIYSSHLCTDWWGEKGHSEQAFVPEWKSSEHWPQEPYGLSCSVVCEGNRLDVFYWGPIPVRAEGSLL